MNGVHDVGGLHGFGPVQSDPDEPVFHADWERRVLALHVGVGLAGHWTLDEYRHARESLTPAEFLSASYYETVLAGVERMATVLTSRPPPSPGAKRPESGRSAPSLARAQGWLLQGAIGASA